jgi:hypothetical protein
MKTLEIAIFTAFIDQHTPKPHKIPSPDEPSEIPFQLIRETLEYREFLFGTPITFDLKITKTNSDVVWAMSANPSLPKPVNTKRLRVASQPMIRANTSFRKQKVSSDRNQGVYE